MVFDPVVEVGGVEANEFADLEVVDSSLGDESADEAWGDVESLGGFVDVEEWWVHRGQQSSSDFPSEFPRHCPSGVSAFDSEVGSLPVVFGLVELAELVEEVLVG